MTTVKHLQLTLAILKPHVVSNPIALHEIRRIIIDEKFEIVNSMRRRLTQADAAAFYEEHRNKFFYNRLVTFMTSGTSEVYVLAKNNAIAEWRRLMGPTKVFRTQFEAPNTIRGLFGLSDTRNATHGSESARREIGILFPQFDYDAWYKNEIQYKNGEVQLHTNNVHRTDIRV